MLRSSSIFLAALAVLLTAQSGTLAQHASYAPADAPERLRPAISRADAVFGELQKALLSALTTELAAGGPSQALSVCHKEAEPIARRVAADHGILVGRTSHRLRNAGNAPPEWAKPFISPPASGRASDAKPVAVDLGDRVGVLRPIGTVALCTTCHGPASAIPPEARGKLQTLYPHDEAVGFEPGDLRGWMWAEVPLTR
jgi:hypothetical protein